MYVKLYNRILDSSIADNRQLRHFFTDLLLLADPEGNVVMTKTAIATRIRSTIDEVEWGLQELMRPDPESLTPEHKGCRIIPLDGHGYGWKIVNYESYRDLKTAKEMREKTAERVRKCREKKKALDIAKFPKGPAVSRKMAEESIQEPGLETEDYPGASLP